MRSGACAVAVASFAVALAAPGEARPAEAEESAEAGPRDRADIDAWVIDTDQLRLVPYGRDIRDVESAALSGPRVQRDPFGLRILGSSSPETNRFIEGLRVDSPAFGLTGTSLLVDFVDRIEIFGGGASARDARGTGGAIDAFLKSGSDEFHGSVFGYWSPYEAARTNPAAVSSV